MVERTLPPTNTNSNSTNNHFASAVSDGIATPSDSTPLDFNAVYIDNGAVGTVVVSRDGGVTSSAPYKVKGPQVLCVSGNRVMATGTSVTGGNLIWMKW